VQTWSVSLLLHGPVNAKWSVFGISPNTTVNSHNKEAVSKQYFANQSLLKCKLQVSRDYVLYEKYSQIIEIVKWRQNRTKRDFGKYFRNKILQ